jgi:hypothetical protein
MSHVPMTLTLIASTIPSLLSKSFTLTADGKLAKTSSADLSEGHAQLISCSDLAEFDIRLNSLKGNQALAFGLATGHPDATVRAADKLRKGDIARTKEFFHFAEAPGILMLDHDNTIDGVPIDADVLRARLLEAVPELCGASMLWRVSASSCITNAATGEELNGVKGQRLYIAVQDASLIPAAGKALVARLWAAGMGWIEVGKAGQALQRTLVDASVWQANRLDFAGPPELSPDLIRTTPASRIFGDPDVLFDLRLITANAATMQKSKAAQVVAKSNAKSALADARTAYIALTAPELAKRRGITEEAAHAVLKGATENNTLAGDFELLSQDDTIVTVAELLDEPAKWDGKNFADPLEPDYGGCNKTVARAHLRAGREPVIKSFAHGGMRYRLKRTCRRIRLAPGERARILDESIDGLREQGHIYEFGEGASLARVSKSTAVPVSRDWLSDKLDRTCDFYRVKSVAGEMVEVPQDAPPGIANAIMSKHGERRFPMLDSVVTAPTLRRDGTVFDIPGYDASSGLLYLGSDDNPRVPSAPTEKHALQALSRLWKPLAQFPFAGPEDRGVALAAMLTAVLRGTLPTAPGFAFDAPSAGSGKTLLAKVLGILATGSEPPISSPAGLEEEMRKRLFASLREGARVVVWDNLREPLGGASIDSFLTASTYSDRILGVSETASLPNRAMFICTGNNIRLTGDTWRRILMSRIDPKSETPFAREFAFDPAAVTLRQRQQLVVDALTIVRAHITAGAPRLGKGRTASFELWDDLVRQPVIWIAQLASLAGGMPDFADPLSVVVKQANDDPEAQKLSAFTTAWHNAFGNLPTTVAKAIAASSLSDDLLHDALDEIAGQNGRTNSRILGRWVEKNRGRPHKGYRIDRGSLRDGRQTWIVNKDLSAVLPDAETTH